MTINQISGVPVGGAVTLDTGWRNMAKPGKGDTYRILMSGTYPGGGVLPGVISNEIVPVP